MIKNVKDFWTITYSARSWSAGCPSGQVAVNSPSIVKRPMRWTARWPVAAAQTADAWHATDLAWGRKRLIGCRLPAWPRFGFGMVKKKRRAVGISWASEVGADDMSHYCLSRMRRWIHPGKSWHGVQAQRFFIEHSFREAKSECGMADYQVRRWMLGITIWH